MPRSRKFIIIIFGLAPLLVLLGACTTIRSSSPSEMERIVISPDGTGFVKESSGEPFIPWGVNYGNHGRLVEDFWEEEWGTFAGDFREISDLGGNVVRLHLQFGKFMEAPDRPNAKALDQLRRTLRLAEETGLYLDLTGLACYRPSDVPEWYDALDEAERWEAQASFWRAIAATCVGHPAVFCYNLMNEPVSPANLRKSWYSGNLLGSYDFVQAIALEPAGRTRGEIAVDWIRTLTSAIREHDEITPITVGLLPWVTGWKHLSGFIPAEVAPHLDFISVHIYPKSDQPEEARTALNVCDVGKPVVIEETFPLHCSVPDLEAFLRESRAIATGWMWHYGGITLDEYARMAEAGDLTIAQSIWRAALQSFVRLGAEFDQSPTPTP